MRCIISLSTLCVASAAIAVPMPEPSDLAGLQVVEVDVPDDDLVNLLLRSGLDGLACRPAPGVGPWVVDADGIELLDTLGLGYTPLIPDLETHQAFRNAQRRAARANTRGADTFYNDFRTIPEFDARIDQFLVDHADIAMGVVLGQSHEGRDIRAVVINVDGTPKPAVLFNGCQHAREWISPMTTWYNRRSTGGWLWH